MKARRVPLRPVELFGDDWIEFADGRTAKPSSTPST